MSKKTKTDQLRAATGNTKNGQHITKITAGSSRQKEAKGSNNTEAAKATKAAKDTKDIPTAELVVSETGKTELQAVDKADQELNQPKKLSRKEKRALKKSQKSDEERPVKSYFLLFRPFVALGRYLRDSWREIRQVRWPNRPATWKMTLAVLVYVALFMVFLTLLDVFFTFIFDLLFK